MNEHTYVSRYLSALGTEREAPSLTYLNRLIGLHQRQIVWENVTKIIDTKEDYYPLAYIPPLETYIERIVRYGTGGTCWTLSRGFHWLLEQLDFQVSYLYMHPGHVCLRVDLDQAYYVDVGFCAPLFQAYPLFTSFTVHNERETFTYAVNGRKIEVIREPGPTKTLDPRPINFFDLTPQIQKSNDWEQSMMLQDLRLFKYIDGAPASLINRQLKHYLPQETVEETLTTDEVYYWVEHKFGMSVEAYQLAQRIFEHNRANRQA